jgi:hypothetical protein
VSTNATDTVVLDTVVPTGSVVIAGGATWTTTTSVTLALSASDASSGVSDMRFSNDGTTWSTWETYGSSKSWSLSSGDGTKTVYAQYRDAAENVSSSKTDTIGLDGTAPTGTVSIAGGDSWTSTTSVALTLSASDASSGVDEMRFSNNGSSWSSWETYATSKSWTLTSGDGTKTVYAQYRDTAENVSSSKTDTIGLDGTVPTASLSIASGATWATSTFVTLGITSSDGGSGVADMRFSNDGSTWSSWTTAAATSGWTLTTGDGLKTVSLQVRDAAGNVSTTATDTISLDTAAPTGSLSIAGGASYVATTSVTLTPSASDGSGSGVTDMRFSNDGSNWSAWETYGSSKSWTLSTGDGTKTVYAQYRDTAANVSSSKTDTIGLDTTAPTGSIVIAGGATWTPSVNVTLTLSATDAGIGVADMRFSNDGSSWSTWETYGTSKSWTLTSGTGTKTVHAQYRDAIANASGSFTDTIVIDGTAPTGTVVIANGDSWTRTTSVTLTLSATDDASGVTDMRFSSDGSTWGSWETYGTSKSWTLTTGDGSKTAHAQFRDAAGNVSTTATDGIGLDGTAPTASLSIASGATWTTTRSVSLGITSSDAGSGVSEMRFSDDGSTWATWETASSSKSWTLPTGDGSKTIYLQVRDAARNTSVTTTDTISLDTAAPTGSALIAGGAAYVTSTSVTLTLSASDGSGSGVSDMRFSNDESTWSTWETYGTSKSWTLTTGDGTKTVYVEYRDTAGNTAGFNDTVILDQNVPTGTVSVAGGDTWTSSTSVTLTLAASDAGTGVADMRFSNAGSTWTSWETYGTSKSWTLTTGDGSKTVYAQYRDVAGNVSATASDGIGLDGTAPAASLSIASGATWTTTRSVSLGVTSSDAGSGVSEMRFSDDGSSWGAWETAGSSKTWTLPTGDGSKTVYLQVRDAAGNSSSSATDTITLDTTAPTGSASIASGATYVTSTSVTLTLSASDGSGSGVSDMRFSNDESTWSTWETYGTSKSWTLTTGDGIKTVYVEYRDTAGNTAGFDDTVILDQDVPTGTVTVAGGDAWTTSSSVALTLSATDAGTGVSDMRFSNDGSTWTSWETYGTSKSWTLTTGDGSKTVYAQYRDAAGNISATASDGIGLDGTAPAASLSIASGATWTATRSVSLGITSSDAGSGVSDMRFSDDGSTWSTWETAGLSKSWTLPTGDGSKTVYLQVRDTAGNSSANATDTITLDTTAPTGSVSIASGASYVTSTSVTLTLSASDGASGVSDMRFSNDQSTWSSWETYGTSKSWTLSTGDGTKTVYVEYRDTAGNSAGFNDTVILDQNVPTGTVSVAGGDTWTSSTSVTLTLSATDAGTGVADMRFSNDGSSWSTWETYGTSKSWTLASGDGTKTAYAQYRDVAGNVSATASDGIGLDGTAPTASLSIASGATWTTTRSVSLGVTSSDAGSGVAEMRFSDDGSSWGTWETAGSSKSWTLPTGDGSKTVYLQVRDAARNTSLTTTDTISLDTTAPTGSALIAGGATYVTSTSVTLTLSASDGSGSGVADMRFSNDESAWSTWETYGTSKSWTLSTGDGTKTVYVEYRDTAGNTAGFNDTVILDQNVPTGTVSVAGGDTWTSSTSVTLTLSASDAGTGVSDMRFSNDQSTWSSWETYGTSKSWTLATGDGSKTVYAQYRDVAGNVSATASDGIGLDGTAPTASLSIASGATWTTTRSVSLGVTSSDAGSGVSEMRFSADGSSWSSWETAGSSKSWTLPAGDGSKTVYLQVRDAALNTSLTTTDTISLDTTAPTGSASIAGGAMYVTSTSVTLTLSASDGSGSGVSDMRFSNDESTWSSWETYGTSKSWTVTSGDGTKTVYVEYRDTAGNTAGFDDSVILDQNVPTGTVSVAGGDTWTTSTSVTLTLLATDAGTGVADMRFSNDGSSWSTWETYGTSKSWTLASGDGTKTVYAEYRDVAGNVSSTASDGIGLDGTAPAASLSIASGATWTTTQSVSLGVTSSDAGSGVSEMRFSDDGSSWGSWETAGLSKSWTLPTVDGSKTVYLQVRDSAGNSSSNATDTITLDTTAPTGSALIASGATYVTATSVTLTLSASDGSGSGVSDMRFSHDESTWSSWETYGTSKSWTLTTGDGIKTVYVEYRDTAGNSAGFNDTVILDQNVPTGTVLVAGGDTWTTSTSATLTLSATDAGTGVSDMRFSNDGSTWTSWETYGTSKSWTLSTGDGSKTISAQYRDVAGNISATASDGIGLDGTAPAAGLSIASGATWTATRSVALGITSSDAGSGVSEMRFSDDGSTWGSWETAGSSKSWTLLTGDGSKTVYLQVRDTAGNSSVNATDAITLDTVAPTGSASIAGGASYVASTSVTLTLSASDSASGLSDMRFSNDESTWTSWETYGTSKTWTLTTGDGIKTVYVEYRDTAGNTAGFNDTVILDQDVPTGTVSVAGGDAWTTSTSVTLTLSATDAGTGVSDMRFSNDGSTWGSWETYGTSKSWTLTTGDGTKTAYAQFRDEAGNVSAAANDGIGLDGTAPAASLSIASGATWTTTLSVPLGITSSDAGSGVSEMRFSDDGSTWSAWETAGSSKTWTLPTGDGSKVVYLQVRDTAGNASSTATDMISLDMTAPTGSASIAGGATYVASTSVTLTLSATDNMEAGVTGMRFSRDGSTWSSWENYGVSKSWTLTSGDGTKTVHVEYRDAAGNTVSCTDTVILDEIAPTGTVSIEDGAAWTTASSVTLTLSATDVGSGVTDMRFSHNGSAWGAWETYGASRSWTLTSGDGTKSVYAQFRDESGRTSIVATDGIGLDRVAPYGTILAGGGKTWVRTATVPVALTSGDATAGVTDMAFSTDGVTWAAWTSYSASGTVMLPGGDGAKTVSVRFRDAAGNVSSAAADTISLDTTAPTGYLVLEGGQAVTDQAVVDVEISASDAHSGMAEYRFSDDGTTWEAWSDFVASGTRELPEEGLSHVYVMLSDHAGNESAVIHAQILFDASGPTAAFTVNDDAPYILPGEDLVFAIDATDEAGGSGAFDYKVSYDDGLTWSDWLELDPGFTTSSKTGGNRPDKEGRVTATLVVRDLAGNESDPTAQSFYLIEASPPTPGPKAKYVGSFEAAGNIDTIAIDIAAGDFLSLKLEAKTTGGDVELAVDLVAAGGVKLHTACLPDPTRKIKLSNYEIPASGRYYLIVYRTDESSATGSYKLKTKVTQTAGNAKLKTVVTDGLVRFEAAEGSVFKATIKGDGITAGAITLVGPEGAIPFEAKERSGKVKIGAMTLSAGTGTYELRVAGVDGATVKITITLPPKPETTISL